MKLRERVTEAREKNEFLARQEKIIDELKRENEQLRKSKSGAGKSQEYEQALKEKEFEIAALNTKLKMNDEMEN